MWLFWEFTWIWDRKKFSWIPEIHVKKPIVETGLYMTRDKNNDQHCFNSWLNMKASRRNIEDKNNISVNLKFNPQFFKPLVLMSALTNESCPLQRMPKRIFYYLRLIDEPIRGFSVKHESESCVRTPFGIFYTQTKMTNIFVA